MIYDLSHSAISFMRNIYISRHVDISIVFYTFIIILHAYSSQQLWPKISYFKLHLKSIVQVAMRLQTLWWLWHASCYSLPPSPLENSLLTVLQTHRLLRILVSTNIFIHAAWWHSTFLVAALWDAAHSTRPNAASTAASCRQDNRNPLGQSEWSSLI